MMTFAEFRDFRGKAPATCGLSPGLPWKVLPSLESPGPLLSCARSLAPSFVHVPPTRTDPRTREPRRPPRKGDATPGWASQSRGTVVCTAAARRRRCAREVEMANRKTGKRGAGNRRTHRGGRGVRGAFDGVGNTRQVQGCGELALPGTRGSTGERSRLGPRRGPGYR